ncbi:MAG: hypothetical protein EZS28_015851, partial [Streblomastix strix]
TAVSLIDDNISIKRPPPFLAELQPYIAQLSKGISLPLANQIKIAPPSQSQKQSINSVSSIDTITPLDMELDIAPPEDKELLQFVNVQQLTINYSPFQFDERDIGVVLSLKSQYQYVIGKDSTIKKD